MNKQKYLQEALQYTKAYRAIQPYLMFGNFVESLKRQENKSLIESIQSGIITILEEKVRDALKADTALLKAVHEIYDSPEKILSAVKKAGAGDYDDLLKILYPALMKHANYVHKGNVSRADEYFSKLIDRVTDTDILSGIKSSVLEDFLKKTPKSDQLKTARTFIINFLKNWIVRDVRHREKTKLTEQPVTDFWINLK